ncbi:iron complex transport system ATP-binding protein [Roseovarius nanhaiticus]|uniref:Iron complex transport system ATP-binding protein n=1 Tax=Roseovarius nanhaiticus TaxID=573024 RepID=A0A1N7GE66_9RHOB|nr:ABC transporter ATP-binding protein [Roseovarius nanhaiticus]SEK29092.1 iron complex transport system ATP-binding protein [Roseovarius nanhaiticus]SIS10802.1 iron complex transport system ATP-binding protein [Roseovarius nanhaiticus]
MSLLTLDRLSVRMRGRAIVSDVSLTIEPGEFVGLIGPNGAGKTTLMRAALGLIPAQGHSSLAAMAPRERARAAAWMPQAREIAWPVTVETLVMLGRVPHLGAGQRASPEDRAAVDAAIAQMGLQPLRGRAATRLSGGEAARVLIARALAQQTPLLMADEPTAGLDPAHQISTMETFAALAAEGKSCLVSLHDLGLAVRHCTRLILIAPQSAMEDGQGGLVADGAPEDVLTPERLDHVFGIEAAFRRGEDGPLFQPLRVTR